nr:MAG TPA: hypothetical protein [Caudoviricetes sp.]
MILSKEKHLFQLYTIALVIHHAFPNFINHNL